MLKIMIRKIALLFFEIFISFTFLHAQNPEKIASVTKKLAVEKSDTVRAMLLNDLFVQYRDNDSAKAMQYANQSIELSRSSGFKNGESLVLLNKGAFLNMNGENDAAEKLIEQSLEIRKKTNDFAGQGYCLRALGNVSYDRNDYAKALEYYLAAAPAFEKGNDLKGLSGDYIWVGNVFNEGLHQFDKAAEYFHKSLSIAEKLNDSSLMSYNYNNLGQAYYFAKNYNQALYYYHKAKSLKEILNDERGLGNTLSNISSVFFDIKKYDSAKVYNNSSLSIRQKQNDKKGMASCYLNAGNIYLQLQNFDAANAQYQKALFLGKEIGFKEAVIESYKGLSAYYEAKGGTKEALDYYKKYKEQNDSIFNKDITQQLATLQTKYETSKKQQLIEQQRFELTKKQYWIYGSVGLIAIMFVLSFFYYKNNKLKNEKRLQTQLLMQQTLNSKAIIDAEEKERKRIAGDLHDGIGQLFSTVKMNLEMLIEKYVPRQLDAMQLSEKTLAMVDESCTEVRSIAHQMMPNALIKAGLVSALRDFINQIPTEKIKITIETKGLEERLESNMETVLYRVIQESVNNVIKHAKATTLDIILLRDEKEITVSVEDNGIGFNTNDQSKVAGIGLKNMITRIEYLKGNVEISSTPNKGTVVSIYIPLT